jgi:hypothetical protein
MKFYRYLLFALLLTGITACRNEQTEAEPAPQSVPDLIGHWKMTAFSNLWSVSPPNQAIETGSDTGSLVFWFHADSTYRLLSTHYNIPNDTGHFVTGSGIIGLESVLAQTLFPVLYAPRYSFDAQGKLLLSFMEFTQYTLNDTGASPVLGDYVNVAHTYTFTRQ